MTDLINRREFIKKTATLSLGAGLYPMQSVLSRGLNNSLKILILGIDGMDLHLTHKYMKKGMLPNFSRLAQEGVMCPVKTSFPPQSPVAWSGFSTGGPSSVHGIYDFIHRDPVTMMPYLSTSKVVPSNKTISIDGWKIPLKKGDTVNLRKGKPFWEYLADYDIPATIFKMPGNFPSKSKRVKMVSGMGTPDLRGGYGSFTLFTTSPSDYPKDITGGMVIPIEFKQGQADVFLHGPVNTLRQDNIKTRALIRIWRDRKNHVVRIMIQGNEFLLKKGEWTKWIQVAFPMMTYISEVKGICKIYIKSVHPEFNMYVSPVNIDPSEPSLPIAYPEEYGRELVKNVGFFYTQGLPEDTKALSYDVLSDGEYLDLANQIFMERQDLLDYELTNFSRQDTGVLFFYFSSLDQDSHMFWRSQDPGHPLFNSELQKKYGDTLSKFYIKMDQSLGMVLSRFDIHDPDFRLITMSDHGFASFSRQVNVNTWLKEKGYIDLQPRFGTDSDDFFANVNWSKTAAYNLGINAIYLNLEGRENFGAVPESQSKQLLKKIKSDLLSLQDPKTGLKAVSRVRIIPDKEKRINPYAPDIIIGWNRGYRTSWDSILGGFSKDVITDNNDKWSGDHCIDPDLVPAILFSNRKIIKPQPTLYDITATILSEFGILTPSNMVGTPLF